MHFFSLGSLLLSGISTTIAVSSSNCSNSSDSQVIQYALAIQAYSHLFYSSMPLNKTFFSNISNSSNTDIYINLHGMGQQNHISTLLVESIGFNITGFQFLECNFTFPKPPNATSFLYDAYNIEASLTSAFLGLSPYTKTAEILNLINWLAVQHSTHSTYTSSLSTPVIFPQNGTSFVPILPPDYILGVGNKPFMLGDQLGGCVTAPNGPCS